MTPLPDDRSRFPHPHPHTDADAAAVALAAAERAADAEGADGNFARRKDVEAAVRIRDTDMEPYVGLRYLSKLFKLMALILVVLLFAEVVTGLSLEGGMSVPMLLAESSRLIVLAGLLWGAGDLAILMIDVGHDVRATRILIGRQAAHHLIEHHDGDPADGHAVPVGTPSRPDRGNS